MQISPFGKIHSAFPDANSHSPRVAVIILNWNGGPYTTACIRALNASTFDDFKIVLVDNGSVDDSVPALRQHFPNLDILENGENLGFAQSNNIGIAYALDKYNPEFIWLLNNDTLVEPDALAEIVRAAEGDQRIGVVGAVLVEMGTPHIVQHYGGSRISLWTGASWRATPKCSPNYISGASMFIRRACLEDGGLLDTGYFFYFEDADFCLRIKPQGWKLFVASKAVVRHKGSASIGAQSYSQAYWYRRGLIRFMNSHAPLPRLSFFLITFFRLAIAAMRGQKAVLRGTWDGFLASISKQ